MEIITIEAQTRPFMYKEDIIMHKIKVSVLIPSLNVAPYINECLQSVISQTLQEIEIICVDAGSTDGTLKALHDFARRDSRISILNSPRKSYGYQMNMALQAASGEYIGILESDDYTEPEMFSDLYEAAQKNDADIVKSNYRECAMGKPDVICNPMEPFADGKTFVPYERWQVFWGAPSIWSAIYRREFLLENQIAFTETPGASYQDTAFHFKVLSCARRMLAMDKAYVHYRTDSVNSSLNNKEKVYCVCGEFENLWQYLKARPHLMEKVREIIPYAQYLAYKWNYQRIADSFKVDFLEKASADFLHLKQRGCLEKTYWDADAWEKLKILLLSPAQIYLNRLLKKQGEDIYKAGVLTQVMHYQKRYIYGAGVIGKKTARFFMDNNVCLDGFAVSSANGNPDDVMGLSVAAVDELNVKNEEAIFVVAVKEFDFEDIFIRLNKAGYTNVLFMNKALRQSLHI